MTMLSRTAESLFWIGRYMERADFIARLLDAAQRLSALPTREGQDYQAWESALASAGVAEGYHAAYGGALADEAGVRAYLAFRTDNPSSILSCLTAVRANARSVRTALTSEVWETINAAWNELARFEDAREDREAFARFLDWLKTVTLTFDGAAVRTMLRNDAYWFMRLGSEIERADNTARLLDVKYHLLLPADEEVGGGLDYFQWTTMLREVSALTAYRWLYRSNLQPWLIADMLILNRAMPRSLARCQDNLVGLLDQLAGTYGRRGPSQRAAGAGLAKLTGIKIDDVFQTGLHEFIQGFLIENEALATAIAEQYLS
jgi:uncharacterized alpha-E superfamily protein